MIDKALNFSTVVSKTSEHAFFSADMTTCVGS